MLASKSFPTGSRTSGTPMTVPEFVISQADHQFKQQNKRDHLQRFPGLKIEEFPYSFSVDTKRSFTPLDVIMFSLEGSQITLYQST